MATNPKFNARIDQGRFDKFRAYADHVGYDRTELLKMIIDALPDYRTTPPTPGIQTLTQLIDSGFAPDASL